MEPEEYTYDVIVGVSIGVLNAAMIGTFEKGNKKITKARFRGL